MKLRLTNRRGSLRVCHANRNHEQDQRDFQCPLHYGHHRDHARGRVHPHHHLLENVVYV